MAVLAHVSDLHATPVRVRRLSDFAGKRFLGWLSWRLRRCKIHDVRVLEALVADLCTTAPDQIAVTGDLTNVACREEFSEVLGWLEHLGDVRQVSVVPGNHDAYVAVPREASWDHWVDYLRSDGETGPVAFPTLRTRGPLALVGVNSAHPTPPLFASGTVGSSQLEALECRLGELAESGLCRVILIHHPITEGAVSSRRALGDAGALRAVLGRAGAELVLHGHGHRTLFSEVPGPAGPIPVVGVRSATDITDRDEKRAQYHLYEIESRGSGFRITARIRGWDGTSRFEPVAERVLGAG